MIYSLGLLVFVLLRYALHLGPGTSVGRRIERSDASCTKYTWYFCVRNVEPT